jgi:hypothetical protein
MATIMHVENPCNITAHSPVQGCSHQPNTPGVWGLNCGGEAGVKGATYLGDGPGVLGYSNGGDAIQGHCDSPNHSAVAGMNDNGGVGVYGRGKIAGSFDGPVEIKGNLTVSSGGDIFLADCAEEFDISDSASQPGPGSVMVVDDKGAVMPSSKAYDHRAIGVVSGAGPFRPALVLDRQQSGIDRAPIALVGKVCCKVDATFAPIEVGDLLTTSSTIGHAMKANDPIKAFGSVIGKALAPVKAGQDLIPILVALQ